MAVVGTGATEPSGPFTVFISYSHLDGAAHVAELRRRLPAGTTVLIDREARSGQTFTENLDEMLDRTHVVLLVMTPDSVRPRSGCDLEMSRAHALGIPILPLAFKPVPRQPDWVHNGLVVDLADAGPAGWTKLDQDLAWWSSVDGRRKTRQLRQEVADRSDSAARTTTADPAPTATAGSAAGRSRARVAGRPPVVPPAEFQDRVEETERLGVCLNEAGARLILLIEPGAVGKTAAIGRLWQQAEEGEGPVRAQGLVYLSGDGFDRPTAGLLVRHLASVVADQAARAQLASRLSAAAPAEELLDMVLETLGEQSVIVAIDTVEELLDAESQFADPELRSLLNRFVTRPGHGGRLLVAGRRPPRGPVERAPQVRRVSVGTGLPLEFAERFLTNLGGDALDGATAAEIRALCECTGGWPRALELSQGLLAVSRSRSVGWLINLLAEVPPEGAAERLFAWYLANRPDEELEVLRALAACRHPVPPRAVQHLTAGTGAAVTALLEQLTAQRIIRRWGEGFAFRGRAEQELTLAGIGSPARAALHARAADWFGGERVSAPEAVQDLDAALAEAELRVAAGQLDAAFRLMFDVDQAHLLAWGRTGVLVPTLRALLDHPALADRRLRIRVLSLLAKALSQLEDHESVVRRTDEALRHCRGTGPAAAAARSILHRQAAYALEAQGQTDQAAHRARAARSAAVHSGSRYQMAAAEADLAALAILRGELGTALRRQRAARILLGGDSSDGRPRLDVQLAYNEGKIRHLRGEPVRAEECLRRAVDLARTIGDRPREAVGLIAQADLLLDEGRGTDAVAKAEQAADIGAEIYDRAIRRSAKQAQALALLIGDRVPEAAAAAAIAGRGKPSVLGHALIGIAAYRLGRSDAARLAFQAGQDQAVGLRREAQHGFELLDEHGLTLCGLALSGEPDRADAAAKAFRAAREISSAPGVLRRNEVRLRLFGTGADRRILEQVARSATTAPAPTRRLTR